MNRTTKVLLIILSIIVGLGLVGVLISLAGQKLSNDGFCTTGWQQRRLDKVLEERVTMINQTETTISSTQLLEGYPEGDLQRVDSKASGDCLDGQPASVNISKQIAVDGSVGSIQEKVTSSLVAQGYLLDGWTSDTSCSSLAAVTYARKDDVKVRVRLTQDNTACNSSRADGDADLNSPANSVYIESEITGLGYSL